MAQNPDHAEDFDTLVEDRHFVQEFVVDHEVSLEAFYDEGSEYFKHGYAETFVKKDGYPVQHITTVHTCWESLLELRQQLRVDPKARNEYETRLKKLEKFASLALEHPNYWRSENSGYMYCRARTLGVISRFAPAAALANTTNARLLLSQLWECQPADTVVGAYGAREVVQDPPKVDAKAQYPTNAYHTYWATTAAKRADASWQPVDVDKHLVAGSDRLRLIAGEQMALLAANSSAADPQQLGWALTGIAFHAHTTELVQGAQTYHIVRQGLSQFFEQQDSRGEWPRGAPLFNYSGSGNAYCYIFETIGEMLAVATDPDVTEHKAFADMLRPYARSLVKLLRHADQTALPLPRGGRGWVSGHRPNAHQPEAWATASIFRFAHRLRVLLGNWTNEVAMRDLGARKATRGKDDLAQRGGTLNVGWGSAGVQLATTFALPTLSTMQLQLPANRHFTEDPDAEIISDAAGRSAVLFGPPGTGKTTLVEAVAGLMKWPFVEITPDMFLNEGLDMVSARADQVFRRMMELDRCVILIDEIDELVKSRTDNQAQQLSRFFTTTMLPRLSKLWSAGRVLFFANTNGINEIDPAIKRSGRFDAAIFVLPPGLDAKKQILSDDFQIELPDVVWEKVEAGITGNGGDSDLNWLALIRHDQLASLAQALVSAKGDGPTFNEASVTVALATLSRDLLDNDWAGHNGANTARGLVKEQEALQRREQRLMPVFEFDGTELPGAKKAAVGAYWTLDKTVPKDLDHESFEPPYRVRPNGIVEIDNHLVVPPTAAATSTATVANPSGTTTKPADTTPAQD